MPSSRRLLRVGPYSADLRSTAIDHHGPDPDGLWIVASPMARDQLVVDLCRLRRPVHRPSVFCWDDLWTEIARHHREPPAILSEASARAALVAAIGRARAAGELGPLDRIAELPGLRRELKARFASWTLAERHPDGAMAHMDGVTTASWQIYRHYRAILKEHRAEDAPGLASWASRQLSKGPFAHPSSVTILNPFAPSKSQLRVIEWAAREANSSLVTLPWTGDPDDPAVGPVWETLSKLEFEDEEFGPESSTGRAWVEQNLFEPGLDHPSPGPIDGLSILGGPRGEGLGLILTREIARRIGEGVAPDDILVVVPRWDDDASRAREILIASGIPVSGFWPKSLATDPALSALRVAASIPIDGWELSPIVRLLRNGQLAPSWSTAEERAEAASTLQAQRIFRGRSAIAAAIDRAESSPLIADRAGRARKVFEHLGAILDGPDGPATWSEHTGRLRGYAQSLGVKSEGLESLWDALDDHAMIRDFTRLPVDFVGFMREVEAITQDIGIPQRSSEPGRVRFTTVAESADARARVVFAINLTEGVFPSRESIASADSVSVPIAYACERLSFLRLIGSARDETILIVPTTDEKGQGLLPAGFVDHLLRRLGHRDGIPSGSDVERLDPVFLDHPDLARTPADIRIQAIARAVFRRETRDLLSIVRDPTHRTALEGVAAGFRLVHQRMRTRHFTEYDGLLTDPKIVSRIAADFGPAHIFSPSQIESFALCPFQFFQRYVLRLEPVDDRPELRVDHASRGDRLHKLLEEIHAAVAAEIAEEADLCDRIAAFLNNRLSADADEDNCPSKVSSALRSLEEMALRRTLGKYDREFRRYRDEQGASARPLHFEWNFGLDSDYPQAAASAPPLDLGEQDNLVRLRGKIDRIDRVGAGFRVIDYKTGHAPSSNEVTKDLRAVQLPLYAMAVERHLLDDSADGCDFGYWTLGRRGYVPVSLKDETWPEFRERVIAEVVRLVSLIRAGKFPIEPKRDDCTRFCDYRSTCRVGQVSKIGKDPETAVFLNE